MELLDRGDAFGDDAFDCYAWVEEALIDGGGDVAQLAALVPRLALLSQSLTATVHATLHQLTVSVPQLEAQLAAMQQATLPLAEQLDDIYANVSATPAGKSAHRKKEEERDLEHLVTLHDAKQKLQACSQALTEAAKWGKNVRVCFAYVEDPLLMEKGRHAAPPAALAISHHRPGQPKDKLPTSLAECVCEMRKSLEILKDMPGAYDRQQTMDSLCVQIETKMKSKLGQFLRDEHVDIAQLQWCLEVFASIDRKELVQHEYCKSRPANVHRAWFAFESDEGSERFSAWLEGFYGDVLRMLQRESTNAAEIFGGGDQVEAILLEILENTLTPLNDSFRDRLKKDFEMAHLLRAFEFTSGFANSVVILFRTLESGTGITLLEEEEREKIAHRADTHSSDPGTVILTKVFEPYRIIFDEYTRFASGGLTDQLLRLVPSFVKMNRRTSTDLETKDAVEDIDDDVLGGRNDDDGLLEEFSQRLEDSSTAIWTLVEDSLQQCYMFSAGAAFPEAVESVSIAIQQFSLALTSTVPAIRKYCKTEKDVNGRNTSYLMLQGSESDTSATLVAISPDWSKFHGSLALLKACGTLESNLCAMENRVRVRMREQLNNFLGDPRAGSPRTRRKKSHDASLALSSLLDPLQVVSAVAKIWLRENPTRLSQFQQFAHEQIDSAVSATTSTASLIPTANVFDDAQRSVREWTKEVQILTYDTVFLPISRVLDTLPVSEAWIKTPDSALADLPTFSTLPQEYITMVADRLLSLLPQLEPFAESSSLSKAFIASHGAHDVCVQDEWTRLGKILRLTPSEIEECQRIFDNSEQDTASTEASGAAVSSSATDFVDMWTAAVASGTLAALLRGICTISELSDLGAKQLSADLGYFFNVLSAVSGEGNFIIEDLRSSLELSKSDHVDYVEKLRAETGNVRTQVLFKLNDCVATKRQRAVERRPSFTGSTLNAGAGTGKPQYY